MKHTAVKKMVTGALLVALDIVFGRILFFYTAGNVDRVSLQFLPQALSGALLGPVWGTLICAASDILGMIVNSAGLSFNPLFTLSAAMRGLLYGLILYKRPTTLVRTAMAVVAVTVAVDMLMNSSWLAIFYAPEVPFFEAAGVRLLAKLPVRAIYAPASAAVLFAVSKGLERARPRGLNE